jgi:endo-1,3-1,4-beta-glycanase ExoK
MMSKLPLVLSLALALSWGATAGAVTSAELYQNDIYSYGRFEARIRFAAGDGVVSSFFLWKPGSEVAGTFWNELDFEKLGADCRMQTNPLYGAPVTDHGQITSGVGDLCGEYHTYGFEWTPTYIAWQIDGVEVRREDGEVAAAFEQNAAAGMQIHFNLWPGDATFGGTFDPAILPVQQFISWVQYSSFDAGSFALQWREDFAAGALPSGWATGTWASPKNYSTHDPANVSFASDIAVLSLTADDARGFVGEPPPDGAVDMGAGGVGGSSSNTGAAGEQAAAGGAAATAPTGMVAGGTGGATAPSNGAAGSSAGAAPVNGAAGAPAASAEASGGRSGGGCSLGAASAPRSAWVVLIAGILLVLRQPRRSVRRATRPACK